jgi:hypothetical protein
MTPTFTISNLAQTSPRKHHFDITFHLSQGDALTLRGFVLSGPDSSGGRYLVHSPHVQLPGGERHEMAVTSPVLKQEVRRTVLHLLGIGS